MNTFQVAEEMLVDQRKDEYGRNLKLAYPADLLWCEKCL